MFTQKERNEQICKLGSAGEKIVANIYINKGYEVEMSTNPYDREKDMLVDKTLKTEVKTQVRYVKKDAFTFKPNQKNKLYNADIVVFIDTANGKCYEIKNFKELFDSKKIWLEEDVGGRQHYDTVRTMYFIPMSELTCFYTCSPEELKSLKDNKLSKYNADKMRYSY